jgi:quercetin dioxygenase-like cupin family protein
MNLDTLARLHAEEARNTVTNATVPPIAQITDGRRPRRMVAALAWTAVAAAAAIGAVLLAGPAPDLTPTTLTPAVTEVPVPVSGVELIASQWTSHEVRADGGPEIYASSVAFVGPEGFVITGFTWTLDAGIQTGWWKSAHGETWEVVSDSGTVSPDRTEAAGIVAGEQGMVAFGTHIWFSANGTDWTVVPIEDEGSPPTRGIALESGDYVLYGNDLYAGGAARVLFSEDGTNWDIIPTPVDFSAMVQLDSGQLVATGGKASKPMTWTSTDGKAWTPLSDDHLISQGRGVLVTTMVAGGPGLVAAGMNSDGEPTFWTSVDGRTFQETTSFPLAGPTAEDVSREQPSVQAIAVGQEWMVAVGNTGFSFGTVDPAIWVSRDGVVWEAVPVDLIDRIVSLDHVTYGGSTFVAVGSRNARTVVLRWEPSSS